MSAANTNRVSHRTLRTRYLYLNVFLWKQYKIFAKSQRLLQVAKILFICSFTETNKVFLFKHLLTEIDIFKNVCYQKKCFSGDSFSFFRSRFYQYFTYVLISCEFQTKYLKILKYSAQYIRDHLSGTRVRIWMGSEYDAVFSFSCIASCNLTKTFGFSCMPF